MGQRSCRSGSLLAVIKAAGSGVLWPEMLLLLSGIEQQGVYNLEKIIPGEQVHVSGFLRVIYL